MALYSAYDARSVSPRMPDSNAGPSSSLDQQKPFAWSAPQLQPGSHQGTAATQPDLAFEAAHRWPPALPLSTATASPSSTEAVQSTLSTGSLQQHYPPMAHVSALLQSRSRPNSFADRPNVADLAQRRFSTPPLHHASSQGESFQQTWAAQHPHLASSEAANTTGWRSTGSPSLPSVYSDFSTMPQLRALNTAVSQPSGAPSSYSLSPVTCVPPTYFNYAPTPPTTAASRPVSTSSAYGSLQSLPHLTTSSLDPGQSAPTLASIPSTPAPSSSSNSISDSSSLRRSGTGSSRLESTGPDRSSKQFKCDICPQSFNRNHDLKRHKRIHLAIKPFPCGWCEKTFSRKDALRRHFLVRGCGKGQGQTQEASEAGISKAPGIVALRQAIEEESRRQNCALPASAYPAPEESPPTSGSPSGSGSLVGSPPDALGPSQQAYAATSSDGSTNTVLGPDCDVSNSSSQGPYGTLAGSNEGFAAFHRPGSPSRAPGADWRLSHTGSNDTVLNSVSSSNGSVPTIWPNLSLPPPASTPAFPDPHHSSAAPHSAATLQLFSGSDSSHMMAPPQHQPQTGFPQRPW